MKLNRMPLFVWLMLVTSVMALGAIPPLSAAQIMLLIDRFLGAHFFDTQAGGSAVLWAHFFWIFGHPEVYILVMPAFGFVNEIIPVFSRKAIFGYPAMVAASVGIGFISFTVWAHHMFTVGMSAAANTAFVLSTMIIAVPTGIKIFNWLATMWGGKIHFTVPMLFCTAFLFQFTLAGLTGIMLSVAPFDWQLHNSYFVVAHFHYVIVGGILFALFAAFYYWFPKITGRMMSERLGKWHFWLFVLGFHMTFDFMHIVGLLGMPREIYTYEPGHHWAVWNLIVTVGAFIQAIAVLIFVYNLVRSHFYGELAGNDPWDAWTLEWATTSPPPSYNFAEDPMVRSRRPLWDLKHPEDPDWKYEFETRESIGGAKMTTIPFTFDVKDDPWELPYRGTVGMWCLIAAESAMFLIFVVAYIYYMGKSLSGPTPKEILKIPIFGTICLLSSSITIHLSVDGLKKKSQLSFIGWLAGTILLGMIFLLGTAKEWLDLIYKHHFTIHTSLFGTTFYSLVGLHATHVLIGLIDAERCAGPGTVWRGRGRSIRSLPFALDVLAFCGCRVGCRSHRRIYRWKMMTRKQL